MSSPARSPTWQEALPEPVEPARRLQHVQRCSPFVAALLERNPEWLETLEQVGLPEAGELSELRQRLDLETALRHYRNRHMAAIVWQDLCGLSTLDQTFARLGRLAELCTQYALAEHYQRLAEIHGEPLGSAGQPQSLCVIGLGKLGGGELNLSSDIDILFCYDSPGETSGGRRPLSSEQFFVRQARGVIASLAEVTEHGFCFRVDTRLRPFGDSGPLCCSLAAMEQYYQREGRDWERYALIKARPIAGDAAVGQVLMEQLRPFVYRRYIDFTAVESLQEMHASVQDDARRSDRLDDIKRGPGGIREIEFLAQCFQLLRGGREPVLQSPSLARALCAIEELQLMDAATVAEIRHDYVFLRVLENRIQGMRDQQTHRVPEGDDFDRLQQAIPGSDGQLLEHLQSVRQRVRQRFQHIFPERESPGGNPRWAEIWRQLQQPADTPGTSTDQPGEEGPTPLQIFVRALERQAPSQRARRRLDQFMPLLLHRLECTKLDRDSLNRIFDLVLAISRRSAYLVLLVQNPAALDRMIQLFGRSSWIAERVTRFPALLDELIDPALGQQIPSAEELAIGVERLLRSPGDTESRLEGLNYLKLATTLRIAVGQLQGVFEAAEVQRGLGSLAEVLLQGVLNLAAEEIRSRHGQIPGDAEHPAGSLAIIAYGSLGAGDPGYDSDLDLVFLFQGSPTESDGQRPLNAERYYARLAQRVLSFLTALTPSGRLYEVDTRLRPNGRAGSLVSSLQAFAEYQREQAWTWELQALTRARWIAGCPQTGERFQNIRRETLARTRDPALLRQELAEMRLRIAAEHPVTFRADNQPSDQSTKQSRELTHVPSPDQISYRAKHAAGGLVDIEFLVQLGVLSQAAESADVLQSTLVPEQLAALVATGWLQSNEAEALSQAYLELQLQRLQATLLPEQAGPVVDTTFAADLCRSRLDLPTPEHIP